MSYVQKRLLPGERVIHQAKVHWGIFVHALIPALIGAWIATTWLWFLSIPFFALVVLITIWAFLVRQFSELAITDRRVIAKFGVLGHRTIEKHIKGLEGLVIQQTLEGRLLGFGTIVIGGNSGMSIPVPFIANPEVFKRNLYEVMEAVSAVPQAG